MVPQRRKCPHTQCGRNSPAETSPFQTLWPGACLASGAQQAEGQATSLLPGFRWAAAEPHPRTQAGETPAQALQGVPSRDCLCPQGQGETLLFGNGSLQMQLKTGSCWSRVTLNQRLHPCYSRLGLSTHRRSAGEDGGQVRPRSLKDSRFPRVVGGIYLRDSTLESSLQPLRQ